MREPFRHFAPKPNAEPIARVGRTSITMLRTNLVTRDPRQMEAALQAYEDEEPAIPFILPQRAQWQQWKSSLVDVLGGSANRPRHSGPIDRIPGLIEAVMSGRMAAHPAVPPDFVMSIEEAAGARMGDFTSAPFDESPVAMRDAPEYGRPVTLPGLEEDFVPDLSDQPFRAEGQGIDRAIREVQLTQDRVRSYLVSEVRGRGQR